MTSKNKYLLATLIGLFLCGCETSGKSHVESKAGQGYDSRDQRRIAELERDNERLRQIKNDYEDRLEKKDKIILEAKRNPNCAI